MRIHASRVEIYEPATVCPRDTRGMTSSLGQSTIVMAQLRSDLSLVMTSWVFLIIVTSTMMARASSGMVCTKGGS